MCIYIMKYGSFPFRSKDFPIQRILPVSLFMQWVIYVLKFRALQVLYHNMLRMLLQLSRFCVVDRLGGKLTTLQLF